MGIRIVHEAPKPETVRYLIEQMVTDEWVGRTNSGQTDEEWVEQRLAVVKDRYEHDVHATVAYDGSGAVGIAFSHKLASPRETGCANLKEENSFWKMGNFFVLEDYRGQGIGTQALMSFKSRHASKIVYFAEENNERSIRLAQKCGLFHTHDFSAAKWSDERYRCYAIGKGTRVKEPTWYYHAYLGAIPLPSEVVDNRIMRYEVSQ